MYQRENTGDVVRIVASDSFGTYFSDLVFHHKVMSLVSVRRLLNEDIPTFMILWRNNGHIGKALSLYGYLLELYRYRDFHLIKTKQLAMTN